MEDDGLLLNFAAPSESANVSASKASKSKVTGGRWKDRRKLQLSLQGRGRSSKKTVASGVNNSKVEPRKRETTSTDGDHKKRTTTPHLGPTMKKIKFAETGGETGGKNNSYVSSLFTSNDKATLEEEKAGESSEVHLPSNAPLDTSSFDGIGLNERLSKHLKESLRFKHPTKVQQYVLPKLVREQTCRDLFVKAQTGSGKTLAFLLPMFHRLMLRTDINRDSGIFGLILVPTRELATQIYGVMESLARCCHHIVPGIVIGGEKKKSEKARLRKGVNVLVATPGRLVDHMENTTVFDVSQLRWLVLDEGDKLMELGFEETITKITTRISESSKININQYLELPSKRINVLCSATIQGNVKKLGSIVLENAEMVSIEGERAGTVLFEEHATHAGGKEPEDFSIQSAPDQLIQKVVVVPPKLRLVTMAALLKNDVKFEGRTIVFFSCSDSVDFHFDTFTRDGSQFKRDKEVEGGIKRVPFHKFVDSDESEETTPSVLTAPLLSQNTVIHKLHGSLSQQVRTSTLQSFVKGNFPLVGDAPKHSILFCTDVAARGLDLPNISNVVEFDPPFSIEDHLHRIGRTARVGQEGDATLFLLPGIEEAYVDGKLRIVHPKSSNLRVIPYEGILRQGFSEETSSTVATSNDLKRKPGKWDVHATTWHLDVERWLLEDTGAHDNAVQAFTSHIRAYATHLATERQFFNVKLLHLGHLAKSFGLRETPKKLGKSMGGIHEGQQNSGNSKGGPRKNEDPRKKMLRMAKMAVNSASSEFNY
ncbi:ATP-dependent RNA helicase Dbp7p [[Candida] anglica]